MPGGRPSHAIWSGFTRDSSNPKNIKATCKKCGIVLQAMIKRMEKHEHEHACKNNKRENSDTEESTPNKIHKLDAMVVKTNKPLSEKIDRQIARYVYSCNLPFHTVESSHFKGIFDLVRPGYKTPSEREVSGHLLDEVFAEQLEKSRDDFEGTI